MRRFLTYLLLVPLAIIVVGFSVANRHSVTVSFDPFNTTAPALSFSLPLFVLLFATLALGVVIGGVAAWFRQARWRRMARNERLEADRLRREADRLRQPPARAALPASRDAA
jgi:uncharacterized integral membrane protein